MVDRKKNSRQRGRTTHSYGSMKKNRGAGHRAGRGNAGSGKRADAKKPSLLWKRGFKHKGKVGFKSHASNEVNAVNLSFVEQKIDNYLEKKSAEKKGEVYKIDLGKLGFNKLLGSGKINFKYEITVNSASDKAVKKVEEAGGKVNLPE
ncbi:MAG: uL15m family ribosomal protein [Nanobdellota archaeon]